MAFVKEWKWRRLLVRQRDLSDCGPACLAAVCAFYKKHVSVSRIRQLAKTDPNGTALLGIVEAALSLGLDAKGVRAESPESISTPAIVHVIVDEKLTHYLVLLQITRSAVVVMDPAEGTIKQLSRGQFDKAWTRIAVLLAPGENFRQNKRITHLKKISGFIVPFRSALILASVCAGLVSLLGMATSAYVKEIVDVILVRKNMALLNVISIMVILVLGMQGIVTIMKGRIVLVTGKNINASLIMSYYRHLLRLPQTFYDSMRVGEMLSRINDAAKITAFIHEVAVNLIVDALIVVFSIAAMFYFNWKIGLLVLSCIPLYGFLYFASNRINKRWQRKIAVTGAELDASLVESLGAADLIRNLSLGEYFGRKVSGRLGELLNSIYDASVKQLNIQAAAEFISKVAVVVLLWTGSYFVMNDRMTTGELMLIYTLLMWFTVPLLHLLAVNRAFNEASVSAERLFEILELDTDEKGWKKVNAEELTIEFRDVWFAYGHNGYVLKGINLLIKKGMILGITGKSGSGKSTMASLLVCAHQATLGNILLNGVDIAEIDRTCITQMITVVSPKAALFSGTIRENITIGLQYDEEWLNIICEKLGITAFAMTHMSGIDMMVSEQGNNLSGGQKQRIAIARAIYRHAPLLILDEATAAIDTLSEEKIMQTIEWYKNIGNTVIIIAHTESTLKICDNIVILNNGVIK